jgi:hypothetical protein
VGTSAVSAAFKAHHVNFEGSRMREIRTYGLMRGRWADRLRTAAWGLLHSVRRGEGEGEESGGGHPPVCAPHPPSPSARARARATIRCPRAPISRA